MKLPWTRLIRFVATDGRTLRGEPILPSDDFDLGTVTESTGLKAKVITGDDIYDTSGKTKVTDEVVTVKKLLGPLTREDVPVLRCIGLNYAKHSTFISPPILGFYLVIWVLLLFHTALGCKTSRIRDAIMVADAEIVL